MCSGDYRGKVFDEDLVVHAKTILRGWKFVSSVSMSTVSSFRVFFEDLVVERQRFRRRGHWCPVKSRHFRCDTVSDENFPVRPMTLSA